MREFDEMYVIGIDHGYGNMKTANCCFPTGLMKSDTEPTFVSDLLVWNGKYYSIGVGHKEFTANMTICKAQRNRIARRSFLLSAVI